MGVAQFLVDFAHEEVDETFAWDEFLQFFQLLQRLQVAIRREEDGGFVELAKRILRVLADRLLQSD